ncbi:MAG: rod shape-determining protein, partial [Terriglobia bacterium]
TALEKTPPELGADVAEKGIVVTGGGALLRDIDRMLAAETGLPIIITDDPRTCVEAAAGHCKGRTPSAMCCCTSRRTKAAFCRVRPRGIAGC